MFCLVLFPSRLQLKAPLAVIGPQVPHFLFLSLDFECRFFNKVSYVVMPRSININRSPMHSDNGNQIKMSKRKKKKNHFNINASAFETLWRFYAISTDVILWLMHAGSRGGLGRGTVCMRPVQPTTVCNFHKLFHEQKLKADRWNRWTQTGCQDEKVTEILNKQVLRLYYLMKSHLGKRRGHCADY